MKLVKCNRGHYYDSDQFSSCPHCKKMNDTQEETVPVEEVTIAQDFTEPIEASVIINTAEPVKTGEVTDDDGEKTVGYYFSEIRKEPVTGWLVCLNGVNVGQSFNLKTGRNFIGRSAVENDIVLEGDKGVSRDKHAILIFEPKSCRFLVQPGMSSELFYLNDQVVLQPEELKAGDKLLLGKTLLMFVPLCSDTFSWNDYIEE